MVGTVGCVHLSVRTTVQPAPTRDQADPDRPMVGTMPHIMHHHKVVKVVKSSPTRARPDPAAAAGQQPLLHCLLECVAALAEGDCGACFS